MRTTPVLAGPGLMKAQSRPRWPALVGLFESPLFARYGMCWARRYLPLDQAPLQEAERQLRALIQSYHSEELWGEALVAIRSHVRTSVEKGIHDHLVSDLQPQALADLAKEDFSAVLAPSPL